MNIGLFFGSFNPIHVGHLAIADYMANYTEMEQVWFVVSPQNPLKPKTTLLQDYHRLALVEQAIEGNNLLRASNIEFRLPIPSYTVTTLAYLKEQFPQHEFCLIMGEDNLRTLHKWYNYESILENYKIYVYPRVHTIQEFKEQVKTEAGNDFHRHKNVKVLDEVPVMKVSSSFIRNAIKEGKEVRYLLTEPVYKYVDEMNFYR